MKTIKNDINLVLLLLILIMVGISCINNKKRVERNYLSDAIKDLKFDDKISWIVILPGLGCHGCIQQGEAFMKDYVDNNSVFFILTEVSSLKILQQKIGINISDYKNIFVDRENEFKVPTNNCIYPCILKIDNGKLTAFEFQCPDNGQAFARLKNQIIANK